MKSTTAAELLRLAENEASKDGALARLDQAAAVLMTLSAVSPEDINVTLRVCSHYYNIQNHNKAINLVTSILHLAQNNIDLLRGKAVILRGMGRAQEAAEILEQVLQYNEHDIVSITTLANIYQLTLGNKERAMHYYELGYEVEPNNLELLQSYCSALTNVGGGDKLSKAYQLAQRIMSVTPSIAQAAEVLQSLSLRMLDYDMYEQVDKEKEAVNMWLNQLNIAPLLFRMGRVKTLEDRLDLVKNHRIYGEKMEARSKLNPISHKPEDYVTPASEPGFRKIPGPARNDGFLNARITNNTKIKIGILSSDLRNHPVAYFVWPIIKHLDRSKFEIHCYSCYPYKADTLQDKIAQRVTSFKVFPTHHSQAIAQAIADDNLDVMFELGGPTSFGRSDICTYRPAPMQVAWLGYPHSLGFPTAIDYIMLDPYINPQVPELLIDKPFIMPHTWVAIDPEIFPSTIIKSIPEDRNGYITLGTLNAPYKLTPEAFKVWADIMHMLPNSKFLYGRMGSDSKAFQQNFTKHMISNGIAAERIAFAPTNIPHLEHYNSIDIAVDTFPHTGGTTTCEALWMGVPVVTLVGMSFFERISYSNLNNAGLGDLCAFTIDEYKNKIMALALDKERRRHLRHHLRQQIMQHPLGQSQLFAEDFAKKITEVLSMR